MLKKIQTSGMTLDKFKTEVIGNLTGDLPQSDTRAMATATFMTRLETDTSFIGQTWRSQTDQTLRSTPTVDTQMLDAMMRDPGSAGKILDRIAAGGAGKPVVLLAGTQNKSI